MQITQSEVRKIAYIDGLRGIAAMMVFFAHLIISQMPAIITFTPSEVHSSFDIAIGLSPLNVLWDGNFGVCIFFVLSGYVLSDFCLHATISFPAQLVRRYFRLALPMLITSTFAWLLLHFGLYKNYDASSVTNSGWLSMWYRFDSNFFIMAKEALYEAFEKGQAVYNSNLWTMRYELIGSAYIFLLHALFKNKNVRLCVAAGFIILHYKDFYSLFACGVLLYELSGAITETLARNFRSNRAREMLAGSAFLFGMFMGSFPAVQPTMPAPWHDWLWGYKNEVAWHMIGAIIVLAALDQSALFQRLLGSRPVVFLGKISFVLYLIHIPVICSLTAWIIVAMKGTPYWLIVAVASVVTVAGVIGLSALLYRYVDLYTTSFSRRAGKTFDGWLPPSARRETTSLPVSP